MPTKDEMRAEIATLREELAAERGKNEVLREQAAHHQGDCHCAHAGWYWCATCCGLRLHGHGCTTITWTARNYGTVPYTVIGGGGASTGGLTQGAAGGPGQTTYTLS